MLSTLGVLALLFTLNFSLVSCGGGAESEASAEAPKSMVADEPETAEPISVSGNTVTVNLTGNDMMKYNINRIEVKAGQKIKLTMTHIGKMEKAVMGHNFVLLQQGADLVDFATKAATSSATDYIPAGEEDKVIAHTKMLGGGESTTIEFDAPAPGTYKFICSFPGHYASMQGDFVVN